MQGDVAALGLRVDAVEEGSFGPVEGLCSRPARLAVESQAFEDALCGEELTLRELCGESPLRQLPRSRKAGAQVALRSSSPGPCETMPGESRSLSSGFAGFQIQVFGSPDS